LVDSVARRGIGKVGEIAKEKRSTGRNLKLLTREKTSNKKREEKV